MSFIRAHKIDWNKFFAAMASCDPYGLRYMPPEVLASMYGPGERKRIADTPGVVITTGKPAAQLA